jgi:hypothetical protein
MGSGVSSVVRGSVHGRAATAEQSNVSYANSILRPSPPRLEGNVISSPARSEGSAGHATPISYGSRGSAGHATPISHGSRGSLGSLGAPADRASNAPANGRASGSPNDRGSTGSPAAFIASALRDEEEVAEYWAEEYALDPGRYAGAEGVDSEMFAHTALSLGMDNEDLLFNLMYFEEEGAEGQGAPLSSVMNSVQQETIALHSENNTPYKLRPASELAISGLCRQRFGEGPVGEGGEGGEGVEGEGQMHIREEDCECAVCKCEMEKGEDVLVIPACSHFFHEECLIRWLRLQGWCPVCRANIDGSRGEKEDSGDIMAVMAGAGADVGEYTPRVDEQGARGDPDVAFTSFSDERNRLGGAGAEDDTRDESLGGLRADSKPHDLDAKNAETVAETVEAEKKSQSWKKGTYVDAVDTPASAKAEAPCAPGASAFMPGACGAYGAYGASGAGGAGAKSVAKMLFDDFDCDKGKQGNTGNTGDTGDTGDTVYTADTSMELELELRAEAKS